MALKSYVLTQDYKAPSSQVYQIPNRPPQVCFKQFRKGDTINGELKHVNNKPSIVLAQGGLIFPISVIKELVTKEVISDASGESKQEEKKTVQNIIAPANNTKIRYLDAIIIGAVLGIGGAYLAEKQGWLPTVDKKNKIYGALIGAGLVFYLTYRHTQNKVQSKNNKE